MMAPRKLIEKVGLMPEGFFLYYEELDWCELISRAGYEMYVVPKAKVFHKESISTGKTSPLKTYYLTRNRILFMRRNRAPQQLLLFYLFLLFFTVPKNSILYLLRGEWNLLKAFFKGLLWHLNAPNIHFNEKQFNLNNPPIAV